MKGIRIKVEKDGLISVSAGKIVPNKDIDNFIILHEEKIIKITEKLKSTIYYINENCKFNNGDIFYIWGEKYKIIISNKNEIDYNSKTLYLNQKCKNLKENTEKLLRKECEIIFEKFSEKVYNNLMEYKGEKPLLTIKKMKSCWGLCYYKKGKITLNLRLSYFPQTLTEETIYHEYIHFIYPKHDKEFYKLLNKYILCKNNF